MSDQKAMESEVARLSEKAKGIESLKDQLSRLQKVSLEIDKMEEERKYLEDAKLRNAEELQRLAKLRSEIQQERQQLGDLVSELEIEKTQLQREFALAEAARQEMLKAQRQAAREKQDYEDAKARADAEMKAWQEARAAVVQERKQYEQERFLAEEERRQWEKARTAADADRIRWEEIENEVGKIEYRQQGWKNWLNKSSVGLDSIKPRTLDDSSSKAPLGIGWPFGSQRPTSLLNRSAPARISIEPSPQSKLGNTLFMAAPLASPTQGSLPINPEELDKCESVTITLGHLALVKMDFQRADRDGEGALDVQKLGQWVESKGMQSVTYLQLKSMLQQVDVNKSGKIEFWEFFAWQTYLLLQLNKTVDFESWMKFSTQTAYPGALPRPTSRLPPVMTHNKIGLIP